MLGGGHLRLHASHAVRRYLQRNVRKAAVTPDACSPSNHQPRPTFQPRPTPPTTREPPTNQTTHQTNPTGRCWRSPARRPARAARRTRSSRAAPLRRSQRSCGSTSSWRRGGRRWTPRLRSRRAWCVFLWWRGFGARLRGWGCAGCLDSALIINLFHRPPPTPPNHSPEPGTPKRLPPPQTPNPHPPPNPSTPQLPTHPNPPHPHPPTPPHPTAPQPRRPARDHRRRPDGPGRPRRPRRARRRPGRLPRITGLRSARPAARRCLGRQRPRNHRGG